MFASLSARALGLPLTAAETIAEAARAGFGGVDLLVRDIVEAGDDPIRLKSSMDDHGLRGGAWPLPVAWRGDEATFRGDLGALPRLAEVAASLGLSRTCTWIMPDREPSQPHGAHFDLHVARLAAVARILADHGTRLGLEVIGVESFRRPGSEPFVARLADLGPLLAALRGEVPGVGVVADAFHLYAAGEGVDAALAWGVGSVVWAHVADVPAGDPIGRSTLRDDSRGPPGEAGVVDSAGLVAALGAAGYGGPVTAEPMAGWARRNGLSAAEAIDRVAASLRGLGGPLSGPGPRARSSRSRDRG